MAPGSDDGPGPDDDLAELLSSLHSHLRATAERPVDRDASRWLGEAEAVAADVAREEAPLTAVETRVQQVRELLSHVEVTGDPEADSHLEAARDDLSSLEARL